MILWDNLDGWEWPNMQLLRLTPHKILVGVQTTHPIPNHAHMQCMCSLPAAAQLKGVSSLTSVFQFIARQCDFGVSALQLVNALPILRQFLHAKLVHLSCCVLLHRCWRRHCDAVTLERNCSWLGFLINCGWLGLFAVAAWLLLPRRLASITIVDVWNLPHHRASSFKNWFSNKWPILWSWTLSIHFCEPNRKEAKIYEPIFTMTTKKGS